MRCVFCGTWPIHATFVRVCDAKSIAACADCARACAKLPSVYRRETPRRDEREAEVQGNLRRMFGGSA